MHNVVARILPKGACIDCRPVTVCGCDVRRYGVSVYPVAYRRPCLTSAVVLVQDVEGVPNPKKGCVVEYHTVERVVILRHWRQIVFIRSFRPPAVIFVVPIVPDRRCGVHPQNRVGITAETPLRFVPRQRVPVPDNTPAGSLPAQFYAVNLGDRLKCKQRKKQRYYVFHSSAI